MNKYKKIKLASTLGIIGNIFLLIIKGIIGFITNSQSMIADAMNSAGDIFSSLMTFIGNKIASKPSDDDHNMGHGKAEYIYSMMISIIMFILGLIILKDSVLTLINKTQYDYSIWLIIVCIITIITKLSLYIYTNKLSKEYNNLLIKANSKDHLNDSLITSLNLISCILAYFNIFYFDGIVGILISIWIVYTAIKIYMESYNVLMDKSIDEEQKQKVYEIINKYPEIKKTNHFNATPVGYKYQISVTIFVDGNLSTYESHAIADRLEKELTSKIEDIYLAIIHVNPIKEEVKNESIHKGRSSSKSR